MEDFIIKLNQIEDSYYDFVVAVLSYVKKKQSRLDTVRNYIESTPGALSADILEFIADQEDFYDDSVYARSKVG